jgi:hypothetical protein
LEEIEELSSYLLERLYLYLRRKRTDTVKVQSRRTISMKSVEASAVLTRLGGRNAWIKGASGEGANGETFTV